MSPPNNFSLINERSFPQSMKNLIILVILIGCLISPAAISEAVREIDKAGQSLSNGEFKEAHAILSGIKDNSPEVDFCWGWYHGDPESPGYEKEKSTKFMEKSAQGGFREAQVMLVGRYLFPIDPEYTNYNRGLHWAEIVLPWIKKKSEEGGIDAVRTLAMFYSFGIVLEKDLDKARKLYIRAAEAGDKEAIEKLAYMYKHGVGTAADPERYEQYKAKLNQ